MNFFGSMPLPKKNFPTNTPEAPPTQKADLAFGAKNQTEVLPLINEFFKDNAVEYEDEFSTQDFFSEKAVYELKSRHIKHDQYPTAIIGCNKCNLSEKDYEKDLFFIFKYTDGLFYIKYDNQVFAKYKMRPFCRNARTDYHDRTSMVWDIPHQDLKRIA